jgi:hypothetical protein
MPRKGSKQPYKPRKEYSYTVEDIARLAGMTRNALNVAKAHGNIDPEDFRSVVTFLTRRVMRQCVEGELFAAETKAREKPRKAGASTGEKAGKTAGRKTKGAARRK